MHDSEGGFMRNNAKGGAHSSTGHGKSHFASRPPESVTPLLISWLKTASEKREGEVLTLDSKILDKVVICGRIIRVKSETTKTMVQIEDGSDSLMLVSNKKFDEDYSKVYREIHFGQPNLYVKILLDVSFYSNEVLYVPIKATPLANLNYLSYHFLNCLVAQKVRRSGLPTHKVEIKHQKAQTGEPASPIIAPVGRMHDEDLDFDSLSRTVLDSLRFLKKKNAKPVNLEDLVNHLKGRVNKEVIVQALIGLNDSGDVRKVQGKEIYDLY